MDERSARDGASHFLWDADRLTKPEDHHFDPEWWSARGMANGEAAGRGLARFLESPDGVWVLRHNHRGGLFRRLLGDHYTWFGAQRSRVFREWRMLAELDLRGLPVPAPVAARVVRSGLTYRAELITVRVPEAVSLASTLREQPLPATCWQALGRQIARFHAAGAWHADLNAHNILIDDHGRFTLIDFDRSRLRQPGRWRARSVARLRRSLDKLSAEQAAFYFAEADWAAFQGGYLQLR